MAGRKAALKAVDWAAFAERVPPNQRAMFNALKTRNDALTARRECSPAAKEDDLDPRCEGLFQSNKPYKNLSFNLQFSALKVPEPVDTQTAKIDAQEKEAAKSTAEYVQASKARIVQYEQQLQKLKNMIPFEQMTFEDLSEAFPETKLNKEKYPYWPHKPIADL
ncbi:ATP5H synthase, partial [Ptilorrhoa leucosticta]|nr:ATP5H synthase [Ptilorrhoa leucosticta]